MAFVSFWDFLTLRLNPFRKEKALLKSVEDAFPAIARADELLESTRVRSSPNYANVAMAENSMLVIFDLIARIGSAVTRSLHLNFVVIRRMVQRTQRRYNLLSKIADPPDTIRRGKDALHTAMEFLNGVIAKNRVEAQNVRQEVTKPVRFFTSTKSRRSVKTAMGDAQNSRSALRAFDRALVQMEKKIQEYLSLKPPKGEDALREMARYNDKKQRLEQQIYRWCVESAQLMDALSKALGESSHQMLMVLIAHHDLTLDAVENITFLKEHGFAQEKIDAFQKKLGEIWEERSKQLEQLGGEATYLQQHKLVA